MTLTLKDLVTGQTVDVDDDDYQPFWWAEGNGSCDCNRAHYFDGIEEEIEAQHRAANPAAYADLHPSAGLCYGTKRIVIIAADTDEYTLAEFNEGYPDGSWL